MYAITAKNITKHFRIYHDRRDTLFEHFLASVKGKNQYEILTALKNVSFSVEKGECLGIIGRNASGKTTLLRVIAGILQSEGEINAAGKIMPFIELGVGFSQELTGRENIYLYGQLLGLSRKHIDRKFDRIVEFADLAAFIDAKLQTYSSGMQVRLAFATALMHDPDILLIDEILAVGDESFRKKSLAKMLDFIRMGKTVIFVSHSLDEVSLLCKRTILLDRGEIEIIGPTEKVIEYYKNKIYHEDKRIIRDRIAAKDARLLELHPRRKQALEKIRILSGAAQVNKAELGRSEDELKDLDIQISEIRSEKFELIREIKEIVTSRYEITEKRILEYNNKREKLEDQLAILRQSEITPGEEIQKIEEKISQIKASLQELIESKRRSFEEIRHMLNKEIAKSNIKAINELKGLLRFEIKKSGDVRYRTALVDDLKKLLYQELKASDGFPDKILYEIRALLYYELENTTDYYKRQELLAELRSILHERIREGKAGENTALISELRGLLQDSSNRPIF
ncbi:MAG: ATP-binding cassette domain-containing protein [archaeon]